jgi:hypothetical protein
MLREASSWYDRQTKGGKIAFLISTALAIILVVGAVVHVAGTGRHGLSEASTCSEWREANTKERDTYAESLYPTEHAEHVKGPEYSGEASKYFESVTQLDEVEFAKQISTECGIFGETTGSEPRHIGEAHLD